MIILALKLVLTPLLIGLASLAQRRLGGTIGGLIAGLPLTSAPVSIFLAVEYGPGFAAQAAVATLFGVVAMSGFCAVYARCAPRLSWPLSLALASAACVAILIAVLRLPQHATLGAGVTFPALLAWVAVIGRADGPGGSPRALWWDTPLRMVVAALAVMLITAIAAVVGPTWSGLLTTLPVFAAVMGVFSHRHLGPRGAHTVLRGIAIGAPGSATFFVVVSIVIEHASALLTYTAAAIAAILAAWATHALFDRVGGSPGGLAPRSPVEPVQANK